MKDSPEQALVVVADKEELGPYTPEVEGRLSAVRNAILSHLARDESLTQKAATALLDSLETKVRIGWLISWAKAYLIGRGSWCRWMEANFRIAQPTLNMYAKFSAHFAPDIPAVQERRRLGVELKGLAAAPGPALRTQIATAGFKSGREAMRLCGILPPSLAEARALGNGKASTKHKDTDSEQLGYILEGLRFLDKRLRLIDPGQLSHEERELLFERLTAVIAHLRELSPA